MKKLIGIIAGLKMGVSSIVMGASLEVVSGGGFLVGLDRLSQQEIRLVREGEFRFDPVSGRFENDDVSLLSWQPDIATSKEFSLDRMLRQICLPTTEIEFVGNLSSGSATPVGETFTKTQRIFDSMGTPHNLIFTFKRLPAGSDSDNQVQYSTEVTVAGGVVKRNDASGVQMDSTGTPMIITFNQRGQLNLVDYGQTTESNLTPKLHIEWTDTSINSSPLEVNIKLGKGKGASPTVWTRIQEPLAEGNLTAYDGNSLITYSKQDGLGYGRYERVTVNDIGKVVAHYSNGFQKEIGDLAFSIVPNPAGLHAIGMSYRITKSSGLPTMALGGQYGWGDIKFTAPAFARPKEDPNKEGRSVDAAVQAEVVFPWGTTNNGGSVEGAEGN